MKKADKNVKEGERPEKWVHKRDPAYDTLKAIDSEWGSEKDEKEEKPPKAAGKEKTKTKNHGKSKPPQKVYASAYNQSVLDKLYPVDGAAPAPPTAKSATKEGGKSAKPGAPPSAKKEASKNVELKAANKPQTALASKAKHNRPVQIEKGADKGHEAGEAMPKTPRPGPPPDDDEEEKMAGPGLPPLKAK